MYEFITVDMYGSMYMAAYYDTVDISDDGELQYSPVLNGKLRKYKWQAWLDAIIWAIKERIHLDGWW